MDLKLLVLILFGCYSFSAVANQADEVRKRKDMLGVAEEKLNEVKDVVAAVTDVTKKLDLGKTFAKLSAGLASLGPVFMAVSAILSIISLFLPQAESEELKALRNGFNEVNKRIDSLESSLEELEIVIEVSSAKTSISASLDAIRRLSEELELVQKRDTAKAWKYFTEQFKYTYKDAAYHLYKTFAGPEDQGDFRLDMLKIFRDKFRCSSTSISRVCLVVMQTVNRGIALEAAYLGATKYPSRLKLMRVVWQRRLEKIRTRCLSVLAECETDWKSWSNKVHTEFWNKHRDTMEAQEFADKLRKTLETAISNRHWAVFMSDGMKERAFGYDTNFPKDIDVYERYNQYDKTMVVMSMPIDRNPNCSGVQKGISWNTNEVYNMKNCRFDWPGPLYYSSSTALITWARRFDQTSAFIALPTKQKPGFSANDNHHMRITWHASYCLSEPHAFFAFC